LPQQDLLEEVQVDFKDAGTVSSDPTAPSGKRQHLVEVCNFVDAGSSRLRLPLRHIPIFMCDPAFDAVVRFLREYGKPSMLTMDRDVRLSWGVRLNAIFPRLCSNSSFALGFNQTFCRRIILN
jgi:hypothetical protein